MDNAGRVSADGGNPIYVRAHRTCHREGTCRQHQDCVSTRCTPGRRATAAARQYAEHRGRRRRHGGSRRACDRLQPSSHDHAIRDRNFTAAGVRPLSSLRLLLEVADPIPPGLRRGPLHGSRALGAGGTAHILASIHPNPCRCCRRGWAIRHNDQPLSLLLAGVGRGGGHAGTSRGCPAPARQARRACGAPPHPLGHLERDVLFRPHVLLHYPRDRRHAPCRRDYRHRHRSPGCECSASIGRQLRIHTLRTRHSRCRSDWRSGARRLRGLCACRGHGLELGSRAQSE